MKKIYFLTLIFFISLLTYKCEVDNTIKPPKQFISYGLYVNKNSINGNIFQIQDNIQHILDSLGLNETPTTFEKPLTKDAETQLDEEQIGKFKNIIDKAKDMFKDETFKDNSNLIGRLINYYGLTKNGINPENIIFLDSITLTLPYILYTQWEDEENPQNYIEILDEHSCKINFKGSQYTTNYEHKGTYLLFSQQNPIDVLMFISPDIAQFRNTEEGKTYTFIKKSL